MGTYRPATLPPLNHTNYAAFSNTIPTLNILGLMDYHGGTMYRFAICECCIKLLLANYNNGIEFAVGWTGFLVQGKAVIDSFSEEVNLRYSLHLSKRPGWTADIELLTKNIASLYGWNSSVAQLIKSEFGNGQNWFTEFKNFRDEEGVHRRRISRNLIVAVGAPHRIQIRGKDVDSYSVGTLAKINDVLEMAYKYM
jgi:hypothetical protein